MAQINDSDVDQLTMEDVDATQEGFDTAVDENDDFSDAVPAFLRDISPLASWTVSSLKPGCGVSALRHPSTALFWQSDGPQPHTLNIHFFKQVSIAYMRIYLDCKLDESYTPTKMTFLAGTGHHDLQVVLDMSMVEPRGWIDIDLSQAGGPDIFDDMGMNESDPMRSRVADQLLQEMLEIGWVPDGASNDPSNMVRIARKGWGPTLRCFLVQVKISENHQNGKDTHLRGLQIFSRDQEVLQRFQPIAVAKVRRASGPAVSALEPKTYRQEPRPKGKPARTADLALRQAAWMDEPMLR